MKSDWRGLWMSLFESCGAEGHCGAQTLFPCYKGSCSSPVPAGITSPASAGSLLAAAFIGLWWCLFDVTCVEQFVIRLWEVTIEGGRCWSSLVIYFFPADKQVSAWKLEKEKCSVIIFSLLCSNYLCSCSKCFTVTLKLLDLMLPQWNRILE